MFHKILLPVDFSDRHDAALRFAGEMAGAGGGAVTLLHVIEVIAGLSMEEEKDFYERLEKTARTRCQQLAAELTARPVACCLEIRYGNRVAEIVRLAREAECDLIVLTCPRLDLNDPGAGLGSLSYKVSYFAPCPVLLVK